jgi:hypothetical protein
MTFRDHLVATGVLLFVIFWLSGWSFPVFVAAICLSIQGFLAGGVEALRALHNVHEARRKAHLKEVTDG